MSKSRVYELAKELNKSNKELLDFLKAKEIEVKNHMSSLSDEQVQMVKGAFGGNKAKSEGKMHRRKRILCRYSDLRTANRVTDQNRIIISKIKIIIRVTQNR